MHIFRPEDQKRFLENLVRNASFSELEIAKHKSLRRFCSKGGKVLFVFDSDIITTIAAPWNKGPVAERLSRYLNDDGQYIYEEFESGSGYGNIFPLEPLSSSKSSEFAKIKHQERSDGVAVATILANRLVELVSDEKSVDVIMQLDRHFNETERVYRTVKSKVDSTGFDASRSLQRLSLQVEHAIKLVSLIGKGSPVDVSPGLLAEKILQGIIERQLSKPKVVSEWDNFYRLHTNYNGIYPTSTFVNMRDSLTKGENRWQGKDAADIEVFSCAFSKAKEAIYSQAGKDLTVKIQRQIESQGGKRAKESASDDVQSVVELYLANSYLSSEEGKTSGSHRVVLVTGDFNLVNAFSHLSGDETGLSRDFGYDCVHHLWSVMDNVSDESSLSDDATERMASGSIWTGLLGGRDSTKTVEQQFEDLKSNILHPVATRVYDDSAKEVTSAKASWKDFVSKARLKARADEIRASEYGDSEKLKSEIVSVVTKARNLEGKSWRDVEDLVVESVQRAKDRTNTVFSNIGSSALIAAHENGHRNPPDLGFGSMPNTDEIFRKLASPTRFYSSVNDFLADYRSISSDAFEKATDDDILEDRQLVHLQYLVLGALFASSDRWAIAQQHGANAAAIVDRAGGMKNNIPVHNESTILSGREAYYLQAVAQRVRATTNEDYAKSLALLNVSQERFEFDRSQETAPNVSSIRYHNERLANALGCYYFHRERDDSSFYGELVEEVMRQSTRMKIKWMEMKNSPNYAGKPIGETWDGFSIGTKVSCATNIIQCMVISRFRSKKKRKIVECPWTMAEIAEASQIIIRETDFVSKLNETLGRKTRLEVPEYPTVICSQMMMRYCLVAQMLPEWPEDTYWAPSGLDDIRAAFSDQVEITTYDGWRYRNLRDFSLELYFNK